MIYQLVYLKCIKQDQYKYLNVNQIYIGYDERQYHYKIDIINGHKTYQRFVMNFPKDYFILLKGDDETLRLLYNK